MISRLAIIQPVTNGAYNETYWVQGDTTVVVRRSGSYDPPLYNYRPRRFNLRDRAYFDACLALDDPAKLYDCVTHVWVDEECYLEDPIPCAAP